MSVIKNYFLIVRDRETNRFKIIDFNNSKGNLLEEIDNYTSDFRDTQSLIKNIRQKGYDVSDNADIYIVQRKKENGHYCIKTQEVLYNTPFLKTIIKDSLNGCYKEDSRSVTEEEKEKAKKTARHLIMMFFSKLKTSDTINPNMINFATYDNHFPEIFREYLSNTPYYKKYDVEKLPKWQLKYYPMLRNLLPYITGNIKLDNPQARRIYEIDLQGRMEIEDEIIKKTDKKYDSNQNSFLDPESDWYIGEGPNARRR